jgi:hypothetical protein
MAEDRRDDFAVGDEAQWVTLRRLADVMESGAPRAAEPSRLVRCLKGR